MTFTVICAHAIAHSQVCDKQTANVRPSAWNEKDFTELITQPKVGFQPSLFRVPLVVLLRFQSPQGQKKYLRVLLFIE